MPDINKKPDKSSLHLNLGLISLILFSLISCENQKEPVYAGAWQFTETINVDGLVFSTIRTLTLSRKSYDETYSVQREGSPVLSEIIGTKGDLTPTHSSMIFHLKELGTCIRDASDICTGNVQWYSEGSQYWNDNIPFFKLIIPGEFEAGESTLWLKRDLNTDGDREDPGEDVLFERI